MELKVTMLCLFVNSETGCVSNWMYPSQVCIHFLSPWTEPEVLVTLKRVPAATECLQARAGSISNFLHIIDLRGKREKKTKTQILFDTAQNRPRQWNSFCILYKYRDTYLINEILLSEKLFIELDYQSIGTSPDWVGWHTGHLLRDFGASSPSPEEDVSVSTATNYPRARMMTWMTHSWPPLLLLSSWPRHRGWPLCISSRDIQVRKS